MKKLLQRLFHKHYWKPYRTEFPVMVTEWIFGSYPHTDDGTVIFSKCECGAKRYDKYQGHYKILEGFAIKI